MFERSSEGSWTFDGHFDAPLAARRNFHRLDLGGHTMAGGTHHLHLDRLTAHVGKVVIDCCRRGGFRQRHIQGVGLEFHDSTRKRGNACRQHSCQQQTCAGKRPTCDEFTAHRHFQHLQHSRSTTSDTIGLRRVQGSARTRSRPLPCQCHHFR